MGESETRSIHSWEFLVRILAHVLFSFYHFRLFRLASLFGVSALSSITSAKREAVAPCFINPPSHTNRSALCFSTPPCVLPQAHKRIFRTKHLTLDTNTMTRALHFFLVLALSFHLSFSWVVPRQHVNRISKPATATSLFLHPNQAKELEEFVCEKMKPTLEEEVEAALAEKVEVYNQSVKERSSPWSWCVQHLTKRGWLTATNHSVDSGLAP